jgi:hypothetical protein
MTVAIKPLNLAELLAQNQELDINRARMAKANRDEERQTRLSEALGRYKYGTPEYVAAVGAVDSSAATGVKNAMNIEAQNANKLNEAFQNDIFKISAAGKQAIDNGANPQQVTQWAMSQLSAAHPDHAGQLKPDLFLQHLDMNATRGGYKNPQAELQEKKREWEEKAKIEQQYGGKSKPYYTTQFDDQGNMLKINARTGEPELALLNGKPVKGAKWDTGLLRETEQAKSAGRKEGEIQGTSAAKTAGYESAASSKQILDIIGMTPGKMDDLINASTGSGVGAGIDALAGAVGVTTKGADALSSLRPIAAKLTGMQPRFEGPQSDADRKYYQEMAGDLANPTVPTPQRINALNAIRGLALKYAMQPTEGAEGDSARVTIRTADEWSKLAPGTKYLTPDGKPKVKK